MRFNEIDASEVLARKAQLQAPAEMVSHRIYRACPVDVTTFREMDYVTKSQKFAIEHSESMYWTEEEPYHVITAIVRNTHESNVLYNATNPGEYFYNGPELKGRVIYEAKEWAGFNT